MTALPIADPARRHCHTARNPHVAIAPSVSRCHPIQRGDRTSRSTAQDYAGPDDASGNRRRHYADQTRLPVPSPPVRTWLIPTPPAGPLIHDPVQRRLATTEVLVVLTVSLGLSALRSGLSLIDALLQPVPLNEQQVALNAPAAQADLVDLAIQLTRVMQLVGWGALGAYLLLRAGLSLRAVGLDGRRPGRDALSAAGLAALIGIPGWASTWAPGRWA